MKIITIIGARPQFIKASLISKYIRENTLIDEVVIHTGQHFNKNMSDVFFEQLNIPEPDYNLDINRMGHAEMTGYMLIKLEKILQKENPQGVLVYGDTNSTLSGSLAAAKLNIPIFHIEAGLRSHNRSMPEEINRIITDHLSSLLFCPTINAVNLLKEEGISSGVIYSGDVMYDLFMKFSNNKEKNRKPFVLATIHRPVNTDDQDKLASIIAGLEKINKTKKVIFPVHPRTMQKINEINIKSKISLSPPFDYIKMIKHLINADLVITDSGGLQKEAFFAKTKCITVRNETEWTELIDIGVNYLCESSEDAIWSAYIHMSEKNCDFSPKLYGNGKAVGTIINELKEFLSHRSNFSD